MRVRSFLAPRTGSQDYPVYDTLLGRKSVMVGLAVGFADKSGIRAMSPGQEVIDRLADLTNEEARLHVVSITDEMDAEERIDKILTTTEPGSAVLLLCADSRILDTTLLLLNPADSPRTIQ
jgi:hypothetical protein